MKIFSSICFLLISTLCIAEWWDTWQPGDGLQWQGPTAAAGDYLDNLDHRWTFDSDLTDSVGSFDFTAQGNAAASGGFLTLDGDGDYVTANRTTIVERTEWSFTAWVRPDSEAQDHDIWVQVNHDTSDSIFWIDEAASDTLGFAIIDTGGQNTGSQLGNAAFTRDGSTWTHVAFTQNDAGGGIFKTYINGVEDNSYTNAAVDNVRDNGTAWYVGGPQNASAAKIFSGEMDDLRIYNAVLTQPQIEQIYDATTH